MHSVPLPTPDVQCRNTLREIVRLGQEAQAAVHRLRHVDLYLAIVAMKTLAWETLHGDPGQPPANGSNN